MDKIEPGKYQTHHNSSKKTLYFDMEFPLVQLTKTLPAKMQQINKNSKHSKKPHITDK